MSATLALVPAKRKSEGRPGKNWEPIFHTASCLELAAGVGRACCDRLYVTSDVSTFEPVNYMVDGWIRRPAELCTPEASMVDVIRHALEAIPGPDDEIIVLLQPTSPLRTTETVQRAIQMLRGEPRATSVVSVSPSYPAEWCLYVDPTSDRLWVPVLDEFGLSLADMPARRQDCRDTFKRDGTVYAFWRRTVTVEGSIYGHRALALLTPPAEALSIDTPEDWDEAVRRLSAR